MIASQSGTCFSDGFAGSCGTPQPKGAYCGWHDYNGNVPYTNLPYMLDAGQLCGENWINKGTTGLADGVSMIAGHEYAETATDPEPPNGWADNADPWGGEIGDKCVWGGSLWGGHDAQGNVTLPAGTFAMQSLWSNKVRACMITSRPGVTVTVPRNRSWRINTVFNYKIHATTNTDYGIHFTARNLPYGLRITKGGYIIGKATRLGTWTVTVTATTIGAHTSVHFTWKIIR